VRLLVEPGDQSPRSWQRQVEIVDTEKQKQAIARLPVIGAHQGRVLMGSPCVKSEQDRSIRVDELTEVVMGGTPRRFAEEGQIPFEASSNIVNCDDRPCSLHLECWEIRGGAAGSKRRLFDNGGALLRRNED